MIELYQKVFLSCDFPQYNLKKGNVAILVDTVPHLSGEEEGYIFEVFNDAEESVVIVIIPFSGVESFNDKIAV